MKKLIPNSTQIPNIIFDDLLSQLKEAELRCLLVIARKTYGFHKEIDKIPHAQFIKMTGMSRSGVKNGIRSLLEKNLIIRHEQGVGISISKYSVDTESEIISSVALKPFKPHFTQIPNAIIDETMASLKEAELRCLLIIARKTYGFHKDIDKIAYSQFEIFTGMKKKAIRLAIKDLIKKEMITQHHHGSGKTISSYSIEISGSLRNTLNLEVGHLGTPSGSRKTPMVGHERPLSGSLRNTTKQNIQKKTKTSTKEKETHAKPAIFSTGENKNLFQWILQQWKQEVGIEINITKTFTNRLSSIIKNIEEIKIRNAVQAFLKDEWRKDKPSARLPKILFRNIDTVLEWSTVFDIDNIKTINVKAYDKGNNNKEFLKWFNTSKNILSFEALKTVEKLSFHWIDNNIIYFNARNKNINKELLIHEFKEKIGQEIRILN